MIPRTTAQVETLDNKPTDASSFDAELFLDWSRDPGAWSASSVMSQEQAAPALAAKEPAVHVVATSGPVAQSPVVEPVMVAPQAPVSIQNTPPTLRAIPADLQPEDRESYLPEPYGGPKPDAVVSASQPRHSRCLSQPMLTTLLPQRYSPSPMTILNRVLAQNPKSVS